VQDVLGGAGSALVLAALLMLMSSAESPVVSNVFGTGALLMLVGLINARQDTQDPDEIAPRGIVG
jgi:hypothetical protein